MILLYIMGVIYLTLEAFWSLRLREKTKKERILVTSQRRGMGLEAVLKPRFRNPLT